MLPDSDLESLVQRTISLYNRIHGPNATIKLVTLQPPLLVVQFTGGFCYGCGVFEFVEGFADQFKMLSGKFELKTGKTHQITSQSFEANFSVKSK
jgi:hypothetical protein